MPNHAPVPSRVPRSLLVGLVVSLVLALVFLLPKRPAGAVPGELGRRLALTMTRLELDEPPGWALQRGNDEVLRNLDRLSWGGPMALRSSLELLGRHRGELAPILLSRLRAMGATDPVLAAKLVALLGGEDPHAPGVIDELIRRALSESGLVAQAGLRVLAGTDHERAMEGILPRLVDADETVRAHARAALVTRARGGDDAARSVVLADLRVNPGDPDSAYVAALDHLGDGPEIDALLRMVEAQAPERIAFVARAALLRRGDPAAIAAFEDMLSGQDPYARINALHGLLAVQVVLGWEHWDAIARRGVPEEVLPLAGLLQHAIDIGHPQALHASELLEALAADRSNGVSVEITDRLYSRRHPWAVEATRVDLGRAVGGALSQVVDRVVDTQIGESAELADVALQRLQTDSVRPEDRVLLLRLVAHVAPAEAVDLLVREALDPESEFAIEMPALITRTGVFGLRRLEQDLGSPAADALYIQVAGDLRSGEALVGLTRILLNDATLPPLRQAALDCIALLHDGPRAEVLREAVDRVVDPALAERARLVYWNYL